MKVIDLEVQAFGAKHEHKVKAVLSDGVWCTYYVHAGYTSLHDPKRGGLGRFSESEFTAPQVLATLKEAYRLRAVCHDTYIGSLKVGDIVLFDGVIKTVGRKALKTCLFMGDTLWGDNFACGTKPVKRLTPNAV